MQNPTENDRKPDERAGCAVAAGSAARAFDALNRMQSIALMTDGAHPRNILRSYVSLAEETLDWAETLLCNAAPPPHSTTQEWDALIRQWRDRRHGVSPNLKDEPRAQNL